MFRTEKIVKQVSHYSMISNFFLVTRSYLRLVSYVRVYLSNLEIQPLLSTLCLILCCFQILVYILFPENIMYLELDECLTLNESTYN